MNIVNFHPLLDQSDCDKDKTSLLVNGFSKGFDIGYRGPQCQVYVSNNLPFRIRSPTDVWNKVMKEVDAK